MSSSAPLLLPVEIKAREFDAKLLLALAACRAGLRVLIGERYAVEANIGRSEPGIYFAKDVTLPVASLYKQIRDLGHQIAAVDEEALVYYTPEIYRQRRFNPETGAQVSCLFAWGDDNVRLWQGLPDFPGTPIVATGNPRFDLLKPRFQYLYEPEVAALRARHGDFVLISTNFGHVNPFRLGEKKMPTWEEIQSGAVKEPRYYDRALSEHRNWLLHAFGEGIRRLISALPNQRFVLRPHPTENQAHWRALLEGCDNVEVLHEGPVIPWVLASRLLIHNGCTTALEAAELGRRTLAFAVDRGRPQEIHLPNRASLEARDEEELLTQARRCLEGDLDAVDKDLAEKRACLKNYLADWDGPLAVERIAEHLARLPRAPKVDLWVYLRSRWQAEMQRRKMKRKERRLSDERRAWKAHVFPPTSHSEVMGRLDSLSKGLDGFRDFQLVERDRNYFELIPKG